MYQISLILVWLTSSISSCNSAHGRNCHSEPIQMWESWFHAFILCCQSLAADNASFQCWPRPCDNELLVVWLRRRSQARLSGNGSLWESLLSAATEHSIRVSHEKLVKILGSAWRTRPPRKEGIQCYALVLDPHTLPAT